MKYFGLEEIPTIVSQELIPLVKTKNIFAFRGPLGAGKTTMIKEFFKQLGVDDVVTSPTFTYVNTYSGTEHKKIYHFDLYRLNSVDEFLQLGFDEYLSESGAICVVEWPEVIESLLVDSEKVVVVDLGYIDGDLSKREMKLLKSFPKTVS
jgi:tRNA threonylcarbamoyladenosine biosynthesis protein TsaE